MLEKWKALGESALSDGAQGRDMLPFSWWKDVGWKQTFEYPVTEFETEAGFYLDVFGFTPAAFSEDYCLLTTPNEEFAFSFRKSATQPDLAPFRLQFFTDELDTVLAAVHKRGIETRVFEGSPGQRVIGITAPSGLPIEIWSGFEG